VYCAVLLSIVAGVSIGGCVSAAAAAAQQQQELFGPGASGRVVGCKVTYGNTACVTDA
jgi:hypothetical protein